jgi:hypothetical protein
MSTICPHIASIQLTRPTGSNHRYEDCLDRWNMGASAHVPVLRSNACCTTGVQHTDAGQTRHQAQCGTSHTCPYRAANRRQDDPIYCPRAEGATGHLRLEEMTWRLDTWPLT